MMIIFLHAESDCRTIFLKKVLDPTLPRLNKGTRENVSFLLDS